MARSARIALDLALNAANSLKPAVAISWEYSKVEVIPPMTGSFFNGPAGKKLEEAVAKFGNGIISSLEEKIRDIDAEEAKKIREQEAALKAEQDRLRAEAKKKEEDKKRADSEKIAAQAKKAKEEKKTETKAEKKPEKKPDPKDTKKK